MKDCRKLLYRNQLRNASRAKTNQLEMDNAPIGNASYNETGLKRSPQNEKKRENS